MSDVPTAATQWVRGTHPYAFRSGKWARIVAHDHRADGRPTWLVEFPDGVTDIWVSDDDAHGWEFSTSPVLTD